MTARDGDTREVIKSSSKRNKRAEKDDHAFQNEPLPGLKRIQNRSISSVTTNLKSKKEEKKVKSVKGKAKSDFKKEFSDFNLKHGSDSEKASNIGTGNKLVRTKHWFSKSQILISQKESVERNPISGACVSYDVCPSKKPYSSPSNNIHDITDNVNANTSLQGSLSTVDSFRGRSMRPRITEDKISECFFLY